MNNGISQALVPVGTMQVDDNEVKRQATFYLEHAKAGSPAFARDLTPIQAAEMARVALAYGLDPLMGELTIYQGRLYVGIDGRTRKATEHPAYDGMELVPATEAERKAFRCGEDEFLWICRVWRKDRRFPFVGYGRAGGASDRNPVSKQYGQEMAQKRAKHRALRDAFSIPLPGQEEADNWQPPAAESRAVDYATGEIIDGEVREAAPPDPRTDQLAAIHVQVKSLGWSEAQYRALLRDAFGVESSKDLSEGQASALLESLAAIGESESEVEALARVKERVDRMLGGRSALDALREVTSDDLEPEPTKPESSPHPRLATREQISELQRLAKPSAQKGVDWDALSFDEAAEWLQSLR